MNKEQIIDEVYEGYLNYPLATIHDHRTNILYQNIDKGWCMLNGRSMVSPHPTRHLTQEEFINKCKTDPEFSEKWGLKIEERELSLEERKSIYETENTNGIEVENNHWLESKLKTRNIPTRAISLMFNMRSNDVPLGLPFNLASYGLLLQIIAKEVNMVPDELIASLGDAHIYVNQIDGVKEQLTREPYKLPTLVMVTNPELKFDEYVYDNFKLVNYQSHPTIKIPLSN